MELKIYSPQDNGFAQVVKWNFQELKAEISETVLGYEMAVYTDDTIKQAGRTGQAPEIHGGPGGQTERDQKEVPGAV